MPYPTVLQFDWSQDDKFVWEVQKFNLLAAIMSKPNWQEKFRTLKDKWREEAEGQLYLNVVKSVFDELELNLDFCSSKGQWIPLFPHVWISDNLIEQELRDSFLKSVSQLEQSKAGRIDYHPGTNNTVVNLIHPSMYCIENGKTFIKRDGEAAVVNFPASNRLSNLPVDEFQWIPIDVMVDENGEIEIYDPINNLDYEQFENFHEVTSILQKFLPAFEFVMNQGTRDVLKQVSRPEQGWFPQETALPYDRDNYEEYYDKLEELREHRVNPEPTLNVYNYKSYIDGLPTDYKLKNDCLQVIVKMANIELTPENPDYAGSAWHLEGTGRENILASGIYYYDSDNIADSCLSFRNSVNGYATECEQDDHDCAERLYGFVDDEEANQNLGSIATLEQRCIVFANYYQHKVMPFSLKDKSKPGHRKILAFFLVNPTGLPIISASDIIDQNAEKVVKILNSKLPVEICEMIVGYCSQYITYEQALDRRERLMKSRSKIDVQVNEGFTESISLCEH